MGDQVSIVVGSGVMLVISVYLLLCVGIRLCCLVVSRIRLVIFIECGSGSVKLK